MTPTYREHEAQRRQRAIRHSPLKVSLPYREYCAIHQEATSSSDQLSLSKSELEAAYAMWHTLHLSNQVTFLINIISGKVGW
jgi:hypothetical protein